MFSFSSASEYSIITDTDTKADYILSVFERDCSRPKIYVNATLKYDIPDPLNNECIG